MIWGNVDKICIKLYCPDIFSAGMGMTISSFIGLRKKEQGGTHRTLYLGPPGRGLLNNLSGL